jgi:hypothetical protein
MADALPVVIVAVTLLAAVIAVATAASSGRSWEQVGRGGLSLRDGSDRPSGESAAAAASAGVAARERDEEIRQMLEARNARRRARGLEPVDVEAEIRQLVVARNARRARQGRAPLDVDAEVARQLRELSGGDAAGA